MKSILILVGALVLVGTMGASKAAAQAPPMNMNWAFQSQMQMQNYGNMVAAQTAQAYYNYMQQLRRAGYRGPSLATGVTPETLRAASQRLQNSYTAYNNAAMQNSNRTSNAVANWDQRAIRGCYWVAGTYGHPVMVCPR